MKDIVIHLRCENDETVVKVQEAYRIMAHMNGVRKGWMINIPRSKEVYLNRDYDSILAEFKKIELL